MNCSDLSELTKWQSRCSQSDEGARLLTDCLYPSFEQVTVYITRHGDGYRVTDGGGAVTVAFRHGRDEYAMKAALTLASHRYSLTVAEGVLVAEALSADWVLPAILAVANGSAIAAMAAVEHISAAQDNDFKLRILEHVSRVFPIQNIAADFVYRGASGKTWNIDFALIRSGQPILIKSISPHHVSINSSYAAFSDIHALSGEDIPRLSVFERRLKAEDATLIRQVADLIPFASLEEGTRRALVGRAL